MQGPSTPRSVGTSRRGLRLVVAALVASLLAAWLVATPAHAAPTGVVTGKVFSKLVGQARKPEHGALVTLYRVDRPGAGDVAATVSTNSKGVFTVTNVPDGRYVVHVQPYAASGQPGELAAEHYPNRPAANDAWHVRVHGNKVTLDDVVLEQSGWVHGTVTDAAGNPLPHASIAVRPVGGGSGYGATIDAQGRFDTRNDTLVRGLLPGTYLVEAMVSPTRLGATDTAHATASKQVTVRPNAGVRVELRMEPIHNVLFAVKHSDGSPVRATRVRVWERREAGGPWVRGNFLTTDADGRVRLDRRWPTKLQFLPAADHAGDDVAEYFDGGAGSYALRDAAVVDWPTWPERRTYTVTLGPRTGIEPGTVAVKGTPKLGKKVKAATKGWPKDVKLAFQWEKNGVPISKATKRKLKITAKLADEMWDLSVRVTATRSGAKPVDADSDRVSIKEVKKMKPGTPRVKGTPKVGETLTAVPGTWGPGKVRLYYLWYDGPHLIDGARSKRLKVTRDLEGAQLRVRVAGYKPGHKLKLRTSKLTGYVRR